MPTAIRACLQEGTIATTALTIPAAHPSPLALWHLLSLDAPTVATLWTIFAARALHTQLPPTLPPAMFLAVWLLYAADRLLDARPLAARVPQVPAQSHRADPGDTPPSPHLQPRHRFHHTHRRPFAVAILIAATALALLVPTLPHALLRPYLLLAALLAVWFALIHLTPLSLPKEFAPGLFFAAAVFLPIPHSLFPATLFAALCTLNCLYIHHWEHPTPPARFAPAVPLGHTVPQKWASRVPHPHDSLTVVRVGLGRSPTAPAQSPLPPHLQSATNPHHATTLALHHLPHLTLAIACLPLLHPTPISLAISLSAVVLQTLNHYRHHLLPTTLRAAADLALLTPILLLPFLP